MVSKSSRAYPDRKQLSTTSGCCTASLLPTWAPRPKTYDVCLAIFRFLLHAEEIGGLVGNIFRLDVFGCVVEG